MTRLALLLLLLALALPVGALGEDVPSRCTIVGTAGDDSLQGTPGDDVICGLAGVDTIWGHEGDVHDSRWVRSGLRGRRPG